jgi:hypothetical protein
LLNHAETSAPVFWRITDAKQFVSWYVNKHKWEGIFMKKTTFLFLVVVIAIFSLPVNLLADTTNAESTGLDEALVTTYLEKKAPGDTGACLVEGMKMNIVGISDVVPGHQAEVFYTFEYQLRCNRGSESKSGRGLLRAARLRDGHWIDRDSFAVIAK